MVAPSAAVIVPTRGRPAYLDVALRTIAPQARERGVEVVVIDDGPDPETRAVAERHGSRYVSYGSSRGLNAARNAGVATSDADLLCFVDDDVAVRPGWLEALLRAAAGAEDDVGVLTGPIHGRIEGHRFPMCGREGPPITWQDLGPDDRDADHAWGANMALRRGALERVGPFDETVIGGGDEQEWQLRLRALGGRIRYVAAAALDHRRAGDDARLRALMAGAYPRGGEGRGFDVRRGAAPPLSREAVVLLGCAVHGPRRRCFNGPVMAAHSLGRLRQALLPRAPRVVPGLDFVSGESGTVGGRRGQLRRVADGALDALDVVSLRRARLAAAARRSPPARRVLVLGVERPGMLMPAVRVELLRSRHDVEMHTTTPGDRGKFENLNALLREHPPG